MKRILVEGVAHDFPDNMPDQEISDVLAKEYQNAPQSKTGDASKMDAAQMFARGASAGGSDYVGATASYIGDRLAHPIATAKSLFGGPDTGQPSFNDDLKEYRGNVDAYREQHPVISNAAEIVGGVTSPIFRGAGKLVDGGLARVGTMLGRNVPKYVGYGAQGVTQGTVAGIGNARGDDGGIPTVGDVIEGGAEGGGMGGVLGVAVPAAGQLAATAGRKVLPVLQSALDRIPGMESNVAARKLAQTLGDDSITSADLMAERARLGPDATLADSGGKNTLRLANTVASLPGKSAELAESTYAPRQASQGTRVIGSVRRNISDTDFHQAIDDISEAQRANAKPLYDEAFNFDQDFPGPTTVSSPQATNEHIDRLLTNPKVQVGLRKGIAIIRDEADADNVPMKLEDYALARNPETGRMERVGKPTLRLLDAAKRGLDDMLEKYRDPITGKLNLNQRGRGIERLRKGLVDQLDKVTTNPETGESLYAKARDAWAGPAKIKDAMWMGRRFARGDEELVTKNFEKMPQTLKDAYLDGMARETIGQIRKNGGAPSSLKKILVESDIRERIEKLLPPDKAAAFIEDIAKEATFSKTANKLLAGSQTAELRAGQEDLGMDFSGPVADLVQGRPVAATAGLIRQVVGFLKSPQLPKASRDKLGEWLMSQDPAVQQQAADAMNKRAQIGGYVRGKLVPMIGGARGVGAGVGAFVSPVSSMTGGSNQ